MKVFWENEYNRETKNKIKQQLKDKCPDWEWFVSSGDETFCREVMQKHKYKENMLVKVENLYIFIFSDLLDFKPEKISPPDRFSLWPEIKRKMKNIIFILQL